MIRVTRLDGSEMYLNQDLIEIIEECPETHLTLTNGNRYLVLEKTSTIVDRIAAFRAGILGRASSTPSRKYLQRLRRSPNPCCPLD